MKELNLVEILRDCPQGTKLYSPLCGECTFKDVADYDLTYQIAVHATNGTPYYFTADGRFFDDEGTECLLFPSKDQRDWSKFQRPFVDGDIITCETYYCKFTALFKNMRNNVSFNYHFMVILKSGGVNYNSFGDFINARFATEEEKQKLLSAIKENGYKWNADEKKLEKLIEPKFKVGDRIKNKNIHKYDCAVQYTIREVYPECYKTDCGVLLFENQDNYELLPNKFDISSLKPFDKVLIRNKNGHVWAAGFFSHITNSTPKIPMAFVLAGGYPSNHCIPYEGNQYLCGTRNDCDEYYKTWEE